jgi:outer membrane protein OmpA-like peptidoglycan-associated protein
MATTCSKCGVSLGDGQMFCTSCGTRRSEPASFQSTKKYCSSCGAAVGPHSSVCNHCGTGLAASTPVQPPVTASAASVSAPNSPTLPSQPLPKKPTSFAFKIAMVVVVLLVLGVLAMAAGVAYVAYVAKKRVSSVKDAYSHNDVAGMIAAAKGDLPAKPQPLPNWKTAPSELVSSAEGTVPLRASLRLVEAGSDQLLGDYESVFTVDVRNKDTLHVKASQQFPKGQGFERFFSTQTDQVKQLNEIACGRTIFLKDLENSAETDGYFCRQNHEERHPGTTAMGLSKKTLQELRTTGKAEFKFHQDPLNAVFSSFRKALTAADDPASKDASGMDLMNKLMSLAPVDNGEAVDTPAVQCTLRREAADQAFPVLINDQPTELPVMHVVCRPLDSDKEAHLYVLDDSENPLFMAAGSSAGGHGQIIKIYFESAKRTGLEDELADSGRAKVYDLYFDFRSDVLRPQSDKVLKEIAQVMHDNSNWKLVVEGHTDNVGGDTFNLDLSKRRAAAVKNALVTRYGIAADRLLTDGFGRSRPVDTNDTLEGRARNRRVELVRQ